MNEPDNPYLPPKAELADFVDPDLPTSRPAAVNIALFLVGIEILLTITSVISGLQRVSDDGYSWWFLLVGAVDVVITILLCVYIASGRNWARIVLLVLWLLGLTLTAVGTYSMYRVMPNSVAYLRSWPNLAYTFAPHMLMLTVSVLLFGPGRGWFRRRETS